MSKNLARAVLDQKDNIVCPFCGSAHFALMEGQHKGHFDRKPIILKQTPDLQKAWRVLESDEVVSLLYEDNLPPRIKLLTAPGERLEFGPDGKLATVAKNMARWAGLLLVAGIASSLLSNDRDEQEQLEEPGSENEVQT
ncbi:MAG TPA: hypothetical protein VF826_16385 [Chloroflexia bacterium]